jgi:hypothetical protein
MIYARIQPAKRLIVVAKKRVQVLGQSNERPAIANGKYATRTDMEDSIISDGFVLTNKIP